MILPQNSQKTYFYKELFVVNLYLDFVFLLFVKVEKHMKFASVSATGNKK